MADVYPNTLQVAILLLLAKHSYCTTNELHHAFPLEDVMGALEHICFVRQAQRIHRDKGNDLYVITATGSAFVAGYKIGLTIK